MREDQYLTVYEAAELLKVHPLTIYRCIMDGRIPASKIGSSIRIRIMDVLSPYKPAIRKRKPKPPVKPD
jgi:excisionase family DNA binding protein